MSKFRYVYSALHFVLKITSLVQHHTVSSKVHLARAPMSCLLLPRLVIAIKCPLYVIISHSSDKCLQFTYEPSKEMTYRISLSMLRRAASTPVSKDKHHQSSQLGLVPDSPPHEALSNHVIKYVIWRLQAKIHQVILKFIDLLQCHHVNLIKFMIERLMKQDGGVMLVGQLISAASQSSLCF